MDFKLFAERVKDARKKAGLSQAELAEKLGVGQNTVSNYENTTGSKGSAPKLETAAKIAEVLNVSLDWLVGQNENNSSQGEISNSEFLSKLIDLVQSDCLTFADTGSRSICAGIGIDHKDFDNFCDDTENFIKAVNLLRQSNLPDEMFKAAVAGLKTNLLDKYEGLLVYDFPF